MFPSTFPIVSLSPLHIVCGFVITVILQLWGFTFWASSLFASCLGATESDVYQLLLIYALALLVVFSFFVVAQVSLSNIFSLSSSLTSRRFFIRFLGNVVDSCSWRWLNLCTAMRVEIFGPGSVECTNVPSALTFCFLSNEAACPLAHLCFAPTFRLLLFCAISTIWRYTFGTSFPPLFLQAQWIRRSLFLRFLT